MAEAFASAASTQLANLLAQEAKFLGGIEGQIKELQTELRLMQSFLRDADARQPESKTFATLRECLADIRDVAYDIEDIIDTYNLKIASKRKEGCWNAIKRYACILKEGWILHDIGSRIDEVKNRINESTRRLKAYGERQSKEGEGSSSSYKSQQERRQSYLHISEDNVVGFEREIEELIEVLVNEKGHFKVVSISGMAGVGKTTLAKKFYKRVQDERYFDHCAWVCVSQNFKKEEVWEAILSDFGVTVDQRNLKPQKLSEQLHNFLEEHRCLVVLDDIWSTKAWDDLQPGLLITERTKSKILLTSRNKDVASRAKSEVHDLKCLDATKSWELFQKITLPTKDFPDHARLETLGRNMVEKCAGLPLAIVVLGGILDSKNGSYREWKKIHDNVQLYIRESENIKVEDLLALSYYDLPSYLKPCFLYLAHFPEDYEINVAKLIHLWVAEGFISEIVEQERKETMEEVGEGYLIELVQRCMIQVGKMDVSLKIETCHMHNVMREFCLWKAKQENWLRIMDDSPKPRSVESFSSVRRLSVLHNPFWIVDIKNPRLRTLMHFPLRYDPQEFFRRKFLKHKFGNYASENKIFEKSFEDLCFKDFVFKDVIVAAFIFHHLFRVTKQSVKHVSDHFNRLRVLHADGTPFFGYLPWSDIGRLIHLRYLSLEGARMWKLPSSLEKLRYLQTLDLRVDSGPFMVEMSNILRRMQELRHLYLPKRFASGTRLTLANLENLQTLVNFPSANCDVKDLSSLTNLKELRMLGSLFQDRAMNCASCILKTCCCCEKIPKASSYLGLQKDPMPVLEKLPNLRILALEEGAFMGKQMVVSTRGFPSLESLILAKLPELEELRVGDGALPDLRHFNVEDCGKLETLPERLRSLLRS